MSNSNPSRIRPYSANSPVVSEDINRMPSISDAAGSNEINVIDNLRTALHQSRLKAKAQKEVQKEAIEIGTSIVLSKLRLDETYLKSRIMVADHERAGELKSKVVSMVEEAIRRNSEHIFKFRFEFAEEEMRRYKMLEESLQAGRMSEDRFRQSTADLQSRIDQDIERGVKVFDSMVEEVVRNVQSLVHR